MPPADEKKPEPIVLKPGEVVVDQATLARVMEQASNAERTAAEATAKAAGLEALFNEQSTADTTGGKKLRERKNFEPPFRTVGIKKYPIKGDIEKLGHVVGWTNRGAYQKVDKSGVAPVIVDFIDIVFLEVGKVDGVLQAESVPLLSLINAEEVICKILETKNKPRKEPTGEEINVTTFDPKHGMVETGDIIDGWVGFTDTSFVIQIPGVVESVEVDSRYVNI